MLPKNRKPTHPGEMLLEEYLKPLGLTQQQLAQHFGWTYARVNELVRGKRGVTPETALALEAAFGASAQTWLNLQSNYDLWQAKQSLSEEYASIERIHVHIVKKYLRGKLESSSLSKKRQKKDSK